MIFVTVGTHEQQFNRLVQYMDEYAATTEETVIIQTGFSTYEPKHCKWQKLFPYREMIKMMEQARIVITHGGPSSFIMALQLGKVPIVVPRQQKYEEHVNNHQVNFCKKVAERQHNILNIENLEILSDYINGYNEKVKKLNYNLASNNSKFCVEFGKIVEDMF